MSIAKLTVKKVNRDTLATTKTRLFNTNSIGELKVDGSDSIFWYTENKADRRTTATEYKVDETNATIAAYFGGAGEYLELSVLKKKVGAVVSDYAYTLKFNLDDIKDGYADPSDSGKSWIVVYPNAFGKIEYQVNAPLGFLDGISNFLSYKFLDSVNGADISADATGVIDYAAKTIAIEVNAGATITSLIATFVVSSNCLAYISTTLQVSGTTSNDMTNPVVYTLVGADGRSVDWTVNTTVAS